jgi:hypothetical protein
MQQLSCFPCPSIVILSKDFQHDAVARDLIERNRNGRSLFNVQQDKITPRYASCILTPEQVEFATPLGSLRMAAAGMQASSQQVGMAAAGEGMVCSQKSTSRGCKSH